MRTYHFSELILYFSSAMHERIRNRMIRFALPILTELGWKIRPGERKLIFDLWSFDELWTSPAFDSFLAKGL